MVFFFFHSGSVNYLLVYNVIVLDTKLVKVPSDFTFQDMGSNSKSGLQPIMQIHLINSFI